VAKKTAAETSAQQQNDITLVLEKPWFVQALFKRQYVD
jgi:hypothetical protein